jgi:hypothetical protein
MSVRVRLATARCAARLRRWREEPPYGVGMAAAVAADDVSSVVDST